MSTPSMVVVGVYRFPVAGKLFRDCMDMWYGYEMPPLQRKEAEKQCRNQLSSLRLVEVELRGVEGKFDFGKITQEIPGQPRIKWQVPSDAQKVEGTDEGERWVFFFHYLDSRKPLLTPFGPVELPATEELPERLKGIAYKPR